MHLLTSVPFFFGYVTNAILGIIYAQIENSKDKLL